MTDDEQTGLSRRIWQQTWPMTLGVLSLLGFNLVDSVFVARLGTEPLAAQSFTFPLVFLTIGIQVGMGIAIAALISPRLRMACNTAPKSDPYFFVKAGEAGVRVAVADS